VGQCSEFQKFANRASELGLYSFQSHAASPIIPKLLQWGNVPESVDAIDDDHQSLAEDLGLDHSSICYGLMERVKGSSFADMFKDDRPAKLRTDAMRAAGSAFANLHFFHKVAHGDANGVNVFFDSVSGRISLIDSWEDDPYGNASP